MVLVHLFTACGECCYFSLFSFLFSPIFLPPWNFRPLKNLGGHVSPPLLPPMAWTPTRVQTPSSMFTTTHSPTKFNTLLQSKAIISRYLIISLYLYQKACLYCDYKNKQFYLDRTPIGLDMLNKTWYLSWEQSTQVHSEVLLD